MFSLNLCGTRISKFCILTVACPFLFSAVFSFSIENRSEVPIYVVADYGVQYGVRLYDQLLLGRGAAMKFVFGAVRLTIEYDNIEGLYIIEKKKFEKRFSTKDLIKKKDRLNNAYFDFSSHSASEIEQIADAYIFDEDIADQIYAIVKNSSGKIILTKVNMAPISAKEKVRLAF